MTEAKIYKQMNATLSEVSAISKDGTNEDQGFRYRGIDQVYSAIHPLLAKHRVFVTAEVLEEAWSERKSKSGGALFHCRVRIRYHFHAEDGSSIATETIGEGMDTSDKAPGKAQSYAYKVAFFQTLCIPVAQDDSDSESHEVEYGSSMEASSDYLCSEKQRRYMYRLAKDLAKLDKSEWELRDYITEFFSEAERPQSSKSMTSKQASFAISALLKRIEDAREPAEKDEPGDDTLTF